MVSNKYQIMPASSLYNVSTEEELFCALSESDNINETRMYDGKNLEEIGYCVCLGHVRKLSEIAKRNITKLEIERLEIDAEFKGDIPPARKSEFEFGVKLGKEELIKEIEERASLEEKLKKRRRYEKTKLEESRSK